MAPLAATLEVMIKCYFSVSDITLVIESIMWQMKYTSRIIIINNGKQINTVIKLRHCPYKKALICHGMAAAWKLRRRTRERVHGLLLERSWFFYFYFVDHADGFVADKSGTIASWTSHAIYHLLYVSFYFGTIFKSYRSVNIFKGVLRASILKSYRWTFMLRWRKK